MWLSVKTAHMMLRAIVLTFALFSSQICLLARGQQTLTPPNSFPHAWPGQPKGAFSPAWQKCESIL